MLDYLCVFYIVYSPSGKLVQIEYALSAVAGGSPSVGIKGMNSAWIYLVLTLFLNFYNYKKIIHLVFFIFSMRIFYNLCKSCFSTNNVWSCDS